MRTMAEEARSAGKRDSQSRSSHESRVTSHGYVAALAIALMCSVGNAQTYPSRPIRFIVPWSAGSGTDLMARAFAQELTKAIGQQVVLDNRGGAGATIGAELAAR